MKETIIIFLSLMTVAMFSPILYIFYLIDSQKKVSR
jgi:hypothetical protein